MPFRLLEGIRLLDLSQYAPGPYASLLLTDLGCDVVRVEPVGGEPMRGIGPLDADGVSAWYKVINRGKRICELDLKSGQGKAAFERLVARADALLESYRPGVLERLGFAPARLQGLNPRLVVCSLSGWGQNGPYRDKVAHDVNYMALMGGLSASGPAAAPAIAYPQVADYASGIQAALCVLAGLIGRGRDGRAAVIDTSIAETVLPWQAWTLTASLRPGFPVARAAMLLNGGAAFYGIYRTKDGRFASLGAVEPKFWHNFCAAAGRPEWATRRDEPLPQSALIAEVAALFESKTLAEWSGILAEAQCCFEPVHAMDALANHPQVAARRLLRRQEGEDPFAEVLFPAWIDGAPEPDRVALRYVAADEVLASWEKGAQA